MKSSRLKRVLKESDSAKKRLKALQSLLGTAVACTSSSSSSRVAASADNSSAEEQKALFRSHFKTIYRMLLGALDLGISSTVSRGTTMVRMHLGLTPISTQMKIASPKRAASLEF